jgi:hypothetical protein
MLLGRILGQRRMNIDDLTLGQIKQIQGLNTGYIGSTSSGARQHPAVGRYVIVRCRDAGVHAGVLTFAEGREAHLRDARRLWQWTAAGGVALSGLAVYGLSSGKIDVIVSEQYLQETCEIIPCTEISRDSIYGYGNQ